MQVGFDLLFLVPGESGGRETYTRELIAASQLGLPIGNGLVASEV